MVMILVEMAVLGEVVLQIISKATTMNDGQTTLAATKSLPGGTAALTGDGQRDSETIYESSRMIWQYPIVFS